MVHLCIFTKSLFNSRPKVLSWIIEDKDVLSGNSLVFEDNPDKLLYIKNNNGLSIEAWGTPAITSDQSETCPFNKTLCFPFLGKLHKNLVYY